MDLTHYRTLGNSGLAVSPLALGTMTFGAGRWGTGEGTSRSVFNTYVEAGGNFVDSADIYSAGQSEEMLGSFIAESGLRDTLVIATKSGFSRTQGRPTPVGVARRTSVLGWRVLSGACAPTISICSGSMCGIGSRPQKKCCKPWWMPSGVEKSFTTVSPIRLAGMSPKLLR